MSGNQQFANFSSALLAANLTNVATSLQVATGFGASFPQPTGSQYFIATIEDTSGNIEVIKVTAVSGDVFTAIVRGQEGTTAQAFTANLARVEVRETAGTFGNFLQKSGDTMAGDLNMGSHNVTNAVIGSGSSIEAATEIVNTPIRGATGVSTNQIVVPTNGTSRATASGLPILCQGDPIPAFTIGMVLAWYGAQANIPALWHICDGSSPTNSQNVVVPVPNLKDQFIIGAGGTNAPTAGTTGGSTATTANGAHNHGGATAGYALQIADIPAHSHAFWAHIGGYSAGSPTFQTYENDNGSAPGYINTVNGNTIIQNTGGGGSHSHGMSTDGSHQHLYLPPFVGLFYIMYIG